jgi:hypothetical protein
MTRKLMNTTAVGVLGILLMALPASAQGQMRGEGRGGAQSNETVRGGGEMRGSPNMRGSAEMRGSADARGRDEIRGGRAERGMRAGADTRTHVRANTRERARTRDNVRVRADVNTSVRSGIRADRRHAWNDNVRWRNDNWRHRDNWRYRDGGTRVRVGIGYSEPYYSYGAYDDGYYASGYSEPYAQRGYADSYYSYAASPGCTCPSSAPYAAYDTDYRWGNGFGVGFTAW